jgi:hypothetical protein
MDYRHMSEMERLMNLQVKYLNYMEELIKEDNQYAQEHPNEELPPVQNLGVLKSHFLTQRKACEGVLSITARHLPRLKAEHDKKVKRPTVNRPPVKTVPNRPVVHQEHDLPIEDHKSVELINLFA